MKCQMYMVFCFVVLAVAEDDYHNKLTRLWSVRGASNDGSSVINVTSASIVIQPSSYSGQAPTARTAKVLYPRYGFKPRAIPVRREEARSERSSYYTQDANEYKPNILFPGNYMSISKEKSDSEQFRPQSIPLIRNEEFQKRSLDVNEEPIIERPQEFSEATASRRSISEMFSVDDEEDDGDDEEGEFEVDEIEDNVEQERHKNKRKGVKVKTHKYKKYMLPLLLAYKMKYFALVPVMIGGLVLLVGATGLAGFFFALFAAVMGLQKGSY